MNFALTRAKSTLFILGDSEKLKSDVTWGKLVDDAQKRGMFMRVSRFHPYLQVSPLKISTNKAGAIGAIARGGVWQRGEWRGRA